MVKRTLSLDGLTGPVTLHLQSFGAFEGTVRIFADPATTYPEFTFRTSPEFQKPILDTHNGHVYLTLPGACACSGPRTCGRAAQGRGILDDRLPTRRLQRHSKTQRTNNGVRWSPQQDKRLIA